MWSPKITQSKGHVTLWFYGLELFVLSHHLAELMCHIRRDQQVKEQFLSKLFFECQMKQV